MSVTAKQVTDAALRLVCHVNAAGGLDKNRESRYYALAPAFITVLQYELAGLEGVLTPLPVESLTQELLLSDETALKVMPCGLAMYFALVDRDAGLYNHYSQSYYGRLVPSIRASETPIKERYIGRGDPMLSP